MAHIIKVEVEKEMKESSKVMIDRIVRKAELLDKGELHAMFEKGMLKTAKPSGEATYSDRPLPSPGSPPVSGSPGTTPDTYYSEQFKSPNVDSKGFGRYSDIAPCGVMRTMNEQSCTAGPLLNE